MQKNKLNLHICGIHLLNPYKAVVSHLKQPRRRQQQILKKKTQICIFDDEKHALHALHALHVHFSFFDIL